MTFKSLFLKGREANVKGREKEGTQFDRGKVKKISHVNLFPAPLPSVLCSPSLALSHAFSDRWTSKTTTNYSSLLVFTPLCNILSLSVG